MKRPGEVSDSTTRKRSCSNASGLAATDGAGQEERKAPALGGDSSAGPTAVAANSWQQALEGLNQLHAAATLVFGDLGQYAKGISAAAGTSAQQQQQRRRHLTEPMDTDSDGGSDTQAVAQRTAGLTISELEQQLPVRSTAAADMKGPSPRLQMTTVLALAHMLHPSFTHTAVAQLQVAQVLLQCDPLLKQLQDRVAGVGSRLHPANAAQQVSALQCVLDLPAVQAQIRPRAALQALQEKLAAAKAKLEKAGGRPAPAAATAAQQQSEDDEDESAEGSDREQEAAAGQKQRPKQPAAPADASLALDSLRVGQLTAFMTQVNPQANPASKHTHKPAFTAWARAVHGSERSVDEVRVADLLPMFDTFLRYMRQQVQDKAAGRAGGYAASTASWYMSTVKAVLRAMQLQEPEADLSSVLDKVNAAVREFCNAASGQASAAGRSKQGSRAAAPAPAAGPAAAEEEEEEEEDAEAGGVAATPAASGSSQEDAAAEGAIRAQRQSDSQSPAHTASGTETGDVQFGIPTAGPAATTATAAEPPAVDGLRIGQLTAFMHAHSTIAPGSKFTFRVAFSTWARSVYGSDCNVDEVRVADLLPALDTFLRYMRQQVQSRLAGGSGYQLATASRYMSTTKAVLRLMQQQQQPEPDYSSMLDKLSAAEREFHASSYRRSRSGQHNPASAAPARAPTSPSPPPATAAPAAHAAPAATGGVSLPAPAPAASADRLCIGELDQLGSNNKTARAAFAAWARMQAGRNLRNSDVDAVRIVDLLPSFDAFLQHIEGQVADKAAGGSGITLQTAFSFLRFISKVLGQLQALQPQCEQCSAVIAKAAAAQERWKQAYAVAATQVTQQPGATAGRQQAPNPRQRRRRQADPDSDDEYDSDSDDPTYSDADSDGSGRDGGGGRRAGPSAAARDADADEMAAAALTQLAAGPQQSSVPRAAAPSVLPLASTAATQPPRLANAATSSSQQPSSYHAIVLAQIQQLLQHGGVATVMGVPAQQATHTQAAPAPVPAMPAGASLFLQPLQLQMLAARAATMPSGTPGSVLPQLPTTQPTADPMGSAADAAPARRTPAAGSAEQ